MSAPFIVLTAFVVAVQQAMFGIPNPRGPFPPTHTPSRPPVELTLPKAVARSVARRRPHAPPSPRRLGKRHAIHEPVALPQLFKLLRSLRPRPPASQAENDGAQTWMLPKPALDFAAVHRKGGSSRSGFGARCASIASPLILASQWLTRIRAARAEAAYEALAHEVRDLFVALQADQARLLTLDNVLAEFERLNILVGGRGAGEQGKHDLWPTGDRASWRARRNEVASETRDTASRLAVLVGDPMWQPEVVGEFKPLGLSTSTRDRLGEDSAAEAHAELTRKVRALAEQRAILDEYEPVLAGQIVELRRLTEDALRNGEVEFRDLADAVGARLELELARINLVENVMHAEVAVLRASGRIEATEGG
ncbi:hypothetical protein [Nannocystis punicea]|uniref:Outer membrane efflux protein n=1 Tax=Nannocystis punicea TaxID=2995304 RepID=A0ABY7H8R9_9BACT|nr:hypothetical protein [Nannocystis poenicansa]WAS95500.1 hypothetical protein O0S08_05005 [Nannocystis poenicansa]